MSRRIELAIAIANSISARVERTPVFAEAPAVRRTLAVRPSTVQSRSGRRCCRRRKIYRHNHCEALWWYDDEATKRRYSSETAAPGCASELHRTAFSFPLINLFIGLSGAQLAHDDCTCASPVGDRRALGQIETNTSPEGKSKQLILCFHCSSCLGYPSRLCRFYCSVSMDTKGYIEAIHIAYQLPEYCRKNISSFLQCSWAYH